MKRVPKIVTKSEKGRGEGGGVTKNSDVTSQFLFLSEITVIRHDVLTLTCDPPLIVTQKQDEVGTNQFYQ